MSAGRRVLVALALGGAAGCPRRAADRAGPSTAELVAVTAPDRGAVVLVARRTLQAVRTVTPAGARPPDGPMLVVADPARGVFYVGNFGGGLGRIDADGRASAVLDLGGALVGMALSPDRRLLAVNGARDLTVRLVDLARFQPVARTVLGAAQDPPRHDHLTHGLASTHPLWLADGSGVLTEDNLHEELVLLGRDGVVRARRRVRSAVHSMVLTPSGEVLAVAEGSVDGTVVPAVLVVQTPGLEVLREMEVPLAPGEPAKLHHGALSADGEVFVVANMGPMHGAAAGVTVAAFRWRTGTRLWSVPTVRNAGHVRFLDAQRVVVLGHQAAELAVLDVNTGARLGTWSLGGAGLLGHALATEPEGTALVVDAREGRLLRLGPSGVVARSPALGPGAMEASLPE